MSFHNIPDIIKCIKFLLMKKDYLPNQQESKYDLIDSCTGETSNETKCLCHTSQNISLNSVIKKNLNKFYTHLNDSRLDDLLETDTSLLLTECLCFGKPNLLLPINNCEIDIIWEYIIVCLRILMYLNQSLQVEGVEMKTEKVQNNEKHHPNIIGVQDQDTVCSLIELVMSFGVLPNLLPGIGRPVKTSSYLQSLLPRTSTHPRKILTILKVLLALMKDNVLHTLILSRNCNDIFAALIQLRHCPLKVCDMPIVSNCCCTNADSQLGCVNCSSICKHEKKWCENELCYLLERTYQPLIIKELLILQRCSVLNKKGNNKWFLRIIGFKLSKCMMQENGVKYVIEGILAGTGGADSVNWQKYQAIGKLIAHVPSQVSSADDYYQLVCPQLLNFLELRNLLKQSNMSTNGTQNVMVSVACMQEMLELNFDLAKKYIFNVLLEPLRKCFDPDGVVDIHSVEVLKCISSMQLICTSELNLSNKFMKILCDVMHPLYVILCLHHNEHFRSFLSSLLVYFFTHMSTSDSVKWLNIFIFGGGKTITPSNEQIGFQTVNTSVKFIVPCNQVVLDETKHMTLDDVPTDEKISAMLALLGDKKLETVRGEFFVGLLKQLSESLTNDDRQTSSNGDSSQDLKDLNMKITDIQHKIQLVSVISALIDTFEYTILQNTPQTVEFIKSILDLPWERNEEGLSFDDGFHEETIDLVLMLISFLLKTDKLTTSDFSILNSLVPSLEKVATNHSKESSRALAIDLKVYIATRGAVTPDESVQRKPKKPSEVDLSSKEAFDDALKELTDPLLPTRGHALFQLSKLLKHRNKYAIMEHKKLLDIFETNLAHHDTYLYLAAIEGLLFLVDVHHREVLPLLCRKFAQFRDGEKEEKFSSELRMKLGEAIVKSCRICGDILPHYTSLLLSALLTGVKDDDHLIRASSLSAIGDVCSLSKFSIGSISTEIVSCIRQIVSTDSAVEVRRAAIQVFSLMFQGIGSRLLQDIPDTLRDIYRLLKSTLIAEKDEMTKLHVSNALDLLDDVMKETLFAKQPLEKKIQILA